MKSKNNLMLILIFIIAIFSSCEQEEELQPVDDVNTEVSGEISDETLKSIPVDLGEIGFKIDTRALAILGYEPSKVSLVIDDSNLGSFSQQDIEVDKWTQMALFKIPVSTLSKDEVAAFSEGVKMTATVFDAAGNELESIESSKFIVISQSLPFIVETSKPRVLKNLAINQSIAHHVQVVFEDNNNVNSFLGGSLDAREGEPLEYWEVGPIQLNAYDITAKDNDLQRQIQKFYFEPQADGSYLIQTAFERSYLEYLETGDGYGELTWRKTNNEEIGFDIEDKHKFYLDQTAEGYVKIRPFTRDSYLKINSFTKVLTSDFDVDSTPDPESYDLKFRILSATVEWDFEELPTLYSAAVIPPTDQDFAYKSTILNCGSLDQDFSIGIDRTEKRTTTISFEESISLSSSKTSSKSATVEAEASGKIFGVGVSMKASGTLATSTTKQFGTNSTQGSEVKIVSEEAVSTKRTAMVQANSAVEIFDVVQRLENVSIPFVKRYILRASDGGIALTGEEIRTQLTSNSFGGVITEAKDDYAILSIRGSVSVDNYFEYRNKSKDIAGGCQ